MNFRKLSLPHERGKTNPTFTKSKSYSHVISNNEEKQDSECNTTERKEKSGAATAFFKGLTCAKPKPNTTRHMDMDNPYMKHTLKRQSKKVADTEDTCTKDTIVLSQNTTNDTTNDTSNNDSQTVESDDKEKPSRQSWGMELPDFSHLPGTIKEFSKVR